jgi:hypothetical protein
MLTETQWGYRKVPQEEFERLQPERFRELLAMG